MWKTILLLLLTLGVIGHAAEPVFFTGMASDTVIEGATTYFDAGSITLTMRDGRGRRAEVSYKNAWDYGRKDGGGQILYVSPIKKQFPLTPHGADEKVVLRLLSTAAVNTYGTADPAALKKGALNSEGRLRDWTRDAVGSLFRQIINRNREEQRPGKKK